MSNPVFKKIEVCDVFAPERTAVFERPREDSQIVKFTVGRVTFYCEAGTLKLISEVLAGDISNPQPTGIS